MTTAIRIPRYAQRWFWLHPEDWEPGIPIYDRDRFEAWQGQRMITEKPDTHECWDEHCGGDGRRWTWVARPDADDYTDLAEYEIEVADVLAAEFCGASFDVREEG